MSNQPFYKKPKFYALFAFIFILINWVVNKKNTSVTFSNSYVLGQLFGMLLLTFVFSLIVYKFIVLFSNAFKNDNTKVVIEQDAKTIQVNQNKTSLASKFYFLIKITLVKIPVILITTIGFSGHINWQMWFGILFVNLTFGGLCSIILPLFYWEILDKSPKVRPKMIQFVKNICIFYVATTSVLAGVLFTLLSTVVSK